ncbi:MAG TPA: FAA hydrolase family protein [Cycloclasticus sp.]|jgi:2-keto-4-pentenoate hydratase/2-oxohepta-3-ene-1,7-dioic acid hydratase in catechol pathway|nr:FAA hydrolase family protein [Cycloclasticus sp.]HIL92869.1 FAA hydrolase family protein [Cycloclasticus sp.]
MKLLNYGLKGQEKPALLDAEQNIRSLDGICEVISSEFLANGRLQSLKNIDINALPLVDKYERIGAPLLNPGKIIAVGLNYDKHIKETGSKQRDEPVLFTKAVSSLNGPFDEIMRPKNASQVDWEIELVVIIGKEAKYITEDEVEDHIAGFCTGIDISERHFQKHRSGQWLKGKSADTFAPIGPYFVTLDEFKQYQSCNVRLDVNGERKQSSNTNTMIHSVKKLVSYINEFMSLQPGDLIFTGTPEGVGLGMKPPQFLNASDQIIAEVEGLGVQEHTVIDCPI